MSLTKSSKLAAKTNSQNSEHANRSTFKTPASEAEFDSSPTWQMLALRPGGVQTKLTASQPDDPFEQEADRVADRVMRMDIQRKCAGCEEEEELQRKEQGPGSKAVETSPAIVHESLSSPGAPLDSTTRTYMEQRFGHDFDNVRVHTGGQADAAARHINSLAFTLGNDVVFREGQYAPHSNEGRRLLAHELTHVVQQSAGSATPAIQRQGTKQASAAVSVLRPDPSQIDSITMTGVATGISTFIYNTRGDIIAIVNQGTQLKVTGKPKGSGLFYEVEYFGKMGLGPKGAEDAPIKGYVLTNFISFTAQPGGSPAMTANNWMAIIPDRGKKGDPAAISQSAQAIEAERKRFGKEIELRPFGVVLEGEKKPRSGLMSLDDERTKTYKTWLYAPDTRPSLAKDVNDIRWLTFRKVFVAEGYPSTIMTYDKTNITWGVGFSGAGYPGVGMTEQMMARLFNQSSESRDAFWRAGITVVGTEMVAVRIIDAAKGKAEKLRGTTAENFVRDRRDLLSLMTNVTIGLHLPNQKDPDEFVRQKNLDAQFETFLHNTLKGSEGIIDKMDLYAAAVAAHAVHNGDHGWGQFHGVTDIAGVEKAIEARIQVLKEQNERAKAKGNKPHYIIPLKDIKLNITQGSGAQTDRSSRY